MARGIEVRLAKARETKNTFRYEEVLPGELAEPVLGTLYVPKRTLREIAGEDSAPERLSVRIEVG